MRVAIVGAGLMGRWHARYAARAGARIAAIVDRNSDAAHALSRSHRESVIFAALDECLRQTRCDAVHICTPTASHASLALEALNAGVHALVEKPVAGNHAETRQLVECAASRGLRLCPVHQFPFQNGFRKARAQLETVRLGTLVSASYTACTGGGGSLADAQRREVVLEILPHPLSLFRALGLGTPALGRAGVAWFSNDELRIQDRQENGASMAISISLRGRPTRNELLLIGTRGSAFVDLYHGYCVMEHGGVSRWNKIARPFCLGGSLLAAASLNLLGRTLSHEPAYPGLPRLIAEFYASIQTGSLAPIRDQEMLDVAAFIEELKSDPELCSSPSTPP